jgi:hypothetical protein
MHNHVVPSTQVELLLDFSLVSLLDFSSLGLFEVENEQPIEPNS